MPNFEQPEESISPENFGKEVEALEQEIKSAQNWEELYAVLEKAEVVEGSQKTYSAEELKALIEAYKESFNPMRRIREGDHERLANSITNTLGLRDKVISLQRAEAERQINGLK